MPRILVIDDEPGWRDLLTMELTAQGHQIVTARNGTEGSEILSSGIFDLILTDVRFPGPMDGVGLVEGYRREKPEQKVIFMTGYAEEERLSKALQHQNTLFLRKPFHLEELFEKIGMILEKRDEGSLSL